MFVHNSCLRVSSGETTLKALLFLGVNPQTPPPFLILSLKQLAFHYSPQIGPRHITCLKENSLRYSLHKQLPTPETRSCAVNAPEEKESGDDTFLLMIIRFLGFPTNFRLQKNSDGNAFPLCPEQTLRSHMFPLLLFVYMNNLCTRL